MPKFTYFFLFNLRNNLMKELKRTLVAVFALIVITQLSTAQKDITSVMVEASENFVALFSAGDVDKFLTVYTDDAILYPGNSSPVSGKENMKELWAGMMSAGITIKFHVTSAEAYGKTAIEEGTVDILAEGEVVDTIQYIVIWKKIKGEWKMYRDMWHSVNPAEAGH
jgi:ketosteroid isomerase-like protein